REPRRIALCGAVFERDVAALDQALLAQPLPEMVPQRPAVDDPDARGAALLRARGERAKARRQRHRADEERERLAPLHVLLFHWITSSPLVGWAKAPPSASRSCPNVSRLCPPCGLSSRRELW